jgi:membrane fusion protein (multidrug efflux system)
VTSAPPPRESPTPHARPAPDESGGELGFDLPAPAALTRTRALGLAALLALAAFGAFLFGYLPKHRAHEAVVESAHAAESAALRVNVVTPQVVSSDHAIVLPGSAQALEETVVYSRANGFVRRWLVDLGDKVTEGQLLAEIDAPELDQELAQARAQHAQAEAAVAQAKANREFSRTNLERFKKLTPAGLTSQQDLDQKQQQASIDEAAVAVALASVTAAQANLRRLSQLKSFARVVAPFAGTVVSRTIERGALVTAGMATPMFKIAALDPIRVFVQVPQDVAPSVRLNVAAKVSVREYAGRTFEGKVTHASGALDPASRTMSTEVRVPNPLGELLPGMYVEVALTLPLPHRVVELPATALLNDSHGLRVAVVDDESKIHLVTVVIERDTGPTVLIASGLRGGERVVKLASSDLVDGRLVDVAK